MTIFQHSLQLHLIHANLALSSPTLLDRLMHQNTRLHLSNINTPVLHVSIFHITTVFLSKCVKCKTFFLVGLKYNIKNIQVITQPQSVVFERLFFLALFPNMLRNTFCSIPEKDNTKLSLMCIVFFVFFNPHDL